MFVWSKSCDQKITKSQSIYFDKIKRKFKPVFRESLLAIHNTENIRTPITVFIWSSSILPPVLHPSMLLQFMTQPLTYLSQTQLRPTKTSTTHLSLKKKAPQCDILMISVSVVKVPLSSAQPRIVIRTPVSTEQSLLYREGERGGERIRERQRERKKKREKIERETKEKR